MFNKNGSAATISVSSSKCLMIGTVINDKVVSSGILDEESAAEFELPGLYCMEKSTLPQIPDPTHLFQLQIFGRNPVRPELVSWSWYSSTSRRHGQPLHSSEKRSFTIVVSGQLRNCSCAQTSYSNQLNQ